MGAESACTLRYRGEVAEGKALLETAELLFRGPVRLKIKFAEMTSCAAKGGELTVAFAGEKAVFVLGALAEKWAEKIKNPRSLIQKLGVKPGHRVVVLGVEEPAFRADLERSGPEVRKRAGTRADPIFFGAERRADLARLRKLRDALEPTGAIWVVRPKGTPAIRDVDVIEAARASGLVDVKVAAFSATHTAEKLVIPVAARSR